MILDHELYPPPVRNLTLAAIRISVLCLSLTTGWFSVYCMNCLLSMSISIILFPLWFAFLGLQFCVSLHSFKQIYNPHCVPCLYKKIRPWLNIRFEVVLQNICVLLSIIFFSLIQVNTVKNDYIEIPVGYMVLNSFFLVPDCLLVASRTSSFAMYSMTSVIDLLNGWKLMLIILLCH